MTDVAATSSNRRFFPPARPAVPGTALRRLVRWLLPAYLLFVVYGSWVPLNFQPVPLTEAWRTFRAVPWLTIENAPRSDLAANLLLFIPLAFLLRERLCASGVVRPAATLRALACGTTIWVGCAFLSTAIEFSQIFFPGRTVSLNDIAAQCAGTLVGLASHAVWHRRLARWFDAIWSAEVGRPWLIRLLRGYVAVLALFAIMPLDLTISVAEIYHKYGEGKIRWRPLSDLPSDPSLLIYELGTDALLWVPVGALLRLQGATMARAAARAAVIAAAIEVMQLFVYSRVSSVTDVLSATVGAIVGAWLFGRWATPIHAGDALVRPMVAESHRRRYAMLAWTIWLALIAIVFWYPFDVRTESAWLTQRWRDAMRVPFLTYYETTEFHALNEILRKTLFFAPGGIAWALTLPRHPHGSLAARFGPVVGLLTALGIETGQLAMPGKVADLTDAAIQWIGFCFGMVIGAHWLRHAQTVVPAGASAENRGDVGPHGSRALVGTHSVATERLIPSRACWAHDGRRPGLGDAVRVATAGITIWAAARLPGVPYNVAELLPKSLVGFASALALGATLWLLFAMPLVLREYFKTRRLRAAPLVFAVPALGMAMAAPLCLSVDDESLFDVVGSPVLGALPALETFGRLSTLLAAVSLVTIGAAWLVAGIARGTGRGMLAGWLIAVCVWAAPFHAVIVTWAATDNLTELMRDGGSAVSSSLLFLGGLSLFAAAFAWVAALEAQHRRARLLGLGTICWTLAAALLSVGSESVLIKYGKVFSATQFLLSSDRQHYAGGAALALRFAAACVVLTVIVALMQWGRWQPRPKVRTGEENR